MNYTRQYYYKQKQDLPNKADKESQLKALVLAERKLLPRLGGRKVYHLIKPHLQGHNLKFGRAKLFRLLRETDLLIKPRRRYIQTTNSKHWMRK